MREAGSLPGLFVTCWGPGEYHSFATQYTQSPPAILLPYLDPLAPQNLLMPVQVLIPGEETEAQETLPSRPEVPE